MRGVRSSNSGSSRTSPRQLLVLVLRFVHPWWLYTAILALCLLGAAGTANVLPTARRAITSGYAAASACFVAAGLAALADTKLVYAGIAGTNFGPTNLAVTFLLLGLVSAALALTCWARRAGSTAVRLDGPNRE